jgi:hypothetical protein
MADSLAGLMTPLAALAGVLLLILFLGRALRHVSRAGPAAPGRLLLVKETIALDTRRRLHLIQHGPRAVLVLTGGDRDLVVGWVDMPP